MKTECTSIKFEFQALGRREVQADFDGGDITSDAGALLLREVDQKFSITQQIAECFTDHRNQEMIEHSVQDLVAQRVFALASGYEDLNDHAQLRHDPLMATLVGKTDPTGKSRLRKRDQGTALAAPSTLNRLELTRPAMKDSDSRYNKIEAHIDKLSAVLVDLFLQMHQASPPEEIILDVDATDDLIHGKQEGRFFHGYYDNYCFLPLYIFCGDFPLCARLRTSNRDGAYGTKEELKWIIEKIRKQWPQVRIVVRGDSGFCRSDIMEWCEGNNVQYILGIARNKRLEALLKPTMDVAKEQHEESGEMIKLFTEFQYRTQTSWNRERRVIGKAQYSEKGANPRFIVTNFTSEEWATDEIYTDLYCARGDMENRIKEQQLDLFADRTSSSFMHSNQLRLLYATYGYVLLNALRHFGLKDTKMARAQCGTIRTKLLKIGAVVKVSVRRVYLALSSACPYQDLFEQIFLNLQQLRC